MHMQSKLQTFVRNYLAFCTASCFQITPLHKGDNEQQVSSAHCAHSVHNDKNAVCHFNHESVDGI